MIVNVFYNVCNFIGWYDLCHIFTKLIVNLRANAEIENILVSCDREVASCLSLYTVCMWFAFLYYSMPKLYLINVAVAGVAMEPARITGSSFLYSNHLILIFNNGHILGYKR